MPSAGKYYKSYLANGLSDSASGSPVLKGHDLPTTSRVGPTRIRGQPHNAMRQGVSSLNANVKPAVPPPRMVDSAGVPAGGPRPSAS